MPISAEEFMGLINFDRYPFLTPNHPDLLAVIAKAHRQLEETGAAELTDFLTPKGLDQLTRDSQSIEGKAFWNALTGNAYLDEPDSSLPEDHARRKTARTSLGAVGYDQFPQGNLLRKIYEWEPFMDFIAALLNLPKIYRYDDPMGALNLSVMKDGDYLRWHFDQSDFVSSLSIRNAEIGGEFEYVPRIRSKENECYDKVKALLCGSREGVVTIANKPGTLLLFQGRYSIHRVTSIKGNTTRLMGLFGYASEPGITGTNYLRKIRYGRTEPLNQD